MFESYLQQSRLSHALLFAGGDEAAKRLAVQQLAVRLLQADSIRIEKEIHPDYHPIRPEEKSGLYAIETIRALIDEVHAAPFEAPAKVFVLFDAERMQPAAANALLKTLEEPNPDTTLILLTNAPSRLLPTILSRCTRVDFPSHPLPSAQGTLFALLANPQPYHCLATALEQIDTDDAEPLLAAILMWVRDQHAKKVGCSEKILFFPGQPAVSHLPSLEKVEQGIEEVRLGLERNIKLSVCLERFLLELAGPA